MPPAEQAAAERIATTGAQTPHGSHVHSSWAVTQVSYPSGYLPASAQETLLQTYLGTQGASNAATLAQRWGHSGQHPIPPQRLQHEQTARTAPAADPDPDPDPETSDSTTSSQDSSSTTDSTETASATTSNSPPPAAEQPSPPGVPQIESRQHHSSATPAPANNVATNPTHNVPNEYREAWLSLDDVDLHTTLQQKHVGFQSPPNFIRGRIRQAMTMSLTSIIPSGHARTKDPSVETLDALAPNVDAPPSQYTTAIQGGMAYPHCTFPGRTLDASTRCRWKDHTYPTRDQHTGATSTASTTPRSPRWIISCPPGIDGRTPCARWCIHPWRTSRPHQAACSPLCTHGSCYHAICPGRAPPTPRRLDHQRPPPHTERSSARSLGPHRRNFALGPWWRRRHPGIPPSFTFTCTSGPAPARKQCHSIGKTRSTPKTEWTHPRPRCWRPPTPSRLQKHSSTLRANNPHSM